MEMLSRLDKMDKPFNFGGLSAELRNAVYRLALPEKSATEVSETTTTRSEALLWSERLELPHGHNELC